MFTFIVISCKSRFSEFVMQTLKDLGPVHLEGQGRSVVKGDSRSTDGWIAVTRSDDVVQDYDADEIKKLGKNIDNLAFFIVEGGFGTKKYHDRFIIALPGNAGYLIDNDHGCIADVAVYQEMVAKGLDWLHCRTYSLGIGHDLRDFG